MADLPTTNARRPVPKFGGVWEPRPVAPTGEAEMGRALMNIGKNITQAANQIQARQDRDELNSRTNQYQKEVLLLQQEMSQSRGADVAEDGDFYKKWQDRENEIRQKILAENQNRRINSDLENRLELGNLNFSRGLINHIERERENYANDTYAGTVETAVDTMAANPDDPSVTAQMRDQIITATNDYADRRGIKGEARKNLLKENLTTGHMEVIEAKIDSGDYSDAREYFTLFKDEIEGEKHNEIEEKLKNAGIRGRSQQAVDQYFLANLTEKQANDQARKDFSNEPELRDATLARIRVRYGEELAIDARTQAAAGEEARSIYQNAVEGGATPSQAYDMIPESVLDAMDSAERMSLYSTMSTTARGQTVKTDWPTYFKLMDWVRDNPGEQLDLAAYQHLLAGTEQKALYKAMNTDPKVFRTETQIINDGLLAIDMDPKDLTKDNAKGQKARDFRLWVEGELAGIPDYTAKDVKEVVDRGVLQVMRHPNRWSWFRGERPAYLVEVENVPTEKIDELSQILSDNGEEVSDENISRLWEAFERHRLATEQGRGR